MTLRKSWLVFPLLGVFGCATARLVGPAPKALEVISAKRVTLEPFFEDAQWRQRSISETRTYYPYNPAYAPISLTRTARWQEKPLYAQTRVLAFEHRLTIEAMKKQVPNWDVTTTSAVKRVKGPVTLVRVVVGEEETVDSNRSAHNWAFAFSWLVLPLFYELTPVHEVKRVQGTIVIYPSTADALQSRLLKYDTQPDYAVNTRGLPRAQETFSIDLEYEEGIFAAEPPKNQRLIAGFSEKLAREITRFIESNPKLVTPAEAAAPAPDAGTVDAGTVDAGTVDAGTVDAGTVDAGTVDAGTVDAGTVDAGTVDAGTVDAGTVDAGMVDAGMVDAGTVDAGTVDAGP